VIGIDVVDGYIATARKDAEDNITFLVVDADGTLPFPDGYFDVVFTKKGPWLFHKGMKEGHRILRSGGIALGLYHCRSDGHFRSLFPGLYQPLPDNHMDEIRAIYEQQLSESGLEKVELQIIEEVEYLSTPEDVLIRKCFGQKESLKRIVWQRCLKDVEEIFYRHATSRGLKVINYHALMIGKAV
jgi:SAM-dependent methyltransferase